MRLFLPFLYAVLPSVAATRLEYVADAAYAVKESVRPPHGWEIYAAPPSDHVIDLQLYLPQPGFPQLEDILYQVSDPNHPSYGAYLPKHEVDALVTPTPDSIAAVDAWLESHGYDLAAIERSHTGDSVSIRVPVHKAEQMLHTKYYIWRHTKSGDALVRTTAYSLPTALHAHIELIQPTTSFSRLNPNKLISHFDQNRPASFPGSDPESHIEVNGRRVDASCNHTITIDCLRQLYNAVGISASGKSGSQIGATGYLEQYASLSDFNIFIRNQTSLTSKQFNVTLINGGLNNQSDPGGEANLDTQFAFGIAGLTPATFWSTGGRPPFKPDLGDPTDTNEVEVHSPAVGILTPSLSAIFQVVELHIGTRKGQPIFKVLLFDWNNDFMQVPISFANRVCAGFAQLGVRGTSVIFSSGDGGVGDGDPDPATQECISNDGTNRTHFVPAFPASCPFVTAVGATFHVPETAVSFSGGGFSNVFPRPAYQEGAVTRFLKKLPKDTYKGLFNQFGRGIPDVSVQGVDFLIFFKGSPALISGTSASAPAFAGLISLINDVRLLKHQKPLGFLNPLLYANPSFFGDITIGNNPGCGTQGFNATAGWDAISGLGTPDIGRMLKEFAWD